MKTERNIEMVKVKRLYHHPDNPRKDLGDLTELVESIRKNGIMQNLTIIPIGCDKKEPEKQPDANEISLISDFYVLIGNRRMEACLQAGLEEVPCKIVSNLSQKEQIGIMLEENMQRNDLTIMEQAEGFQLMLDLGETVDSISEKTGFSKATIYHRVNIAKLDKKVLEGKKDEDGCFQISLKDLTELEKLKDIKDRNEVLEKSNDSRNLKWNIERKVKENNVRNNEKKIKKIFKDAGIKEAPRSAQNERYSAKWKILQEWNLELDELEELKEIKQKDAQWVIFYGRTAAVIIPQKQEKRKLSQWEIEIQDRDRRKKELKAKSKKMCAEIVDFIKALLVFKEIKPLKEDLELYKSVAKAFLRSNVGGYESTLAQLYAGTSLYALEKSEDYEKYKKWRDALTPLEEMIAQMSNIKQIEIFTYNAEYKKEDAEQILSAVHILEKYGFTLTEEMQQLLDGTDESYKKEENH